MELWQYTWNQKISKNELYKEYYSLAEDYVSLKKYEKAIEYYKKILDHPDYRKSATMKLARTYALHKDWENAKSYLGKAVSLNQNNKLAKDLYNYVIEQQEQTILQKALDAYSQGQYTNALGILNNLISQNKNNAYAYYYKGMVFDAQKKYSLAVIEYKKMLSLSNSIPEGYYAIAVDLEYLKQYSEALSNYKKYLKNQISYYQVLKNYLEIHQKNK